MAGAGAPPACERSARRPAGVADEELRPPLRGATRAVRGARRRRPASPSPEAAGPRPGRREHRAAGGRAARPGPCPVRDPEGEIPSRAPGGPALRLRRTRYRPVAPHVSAPPWRVRALHEGESAGGRGQSDRAVRRSAAGSAPSERSQGRPRSAGRLRTQRDRVVGRGHPGKGVTGLGVLGVERRTASRGWLPWSRISMSVRRGLAPISEAASRPLRERAPRGVRGPGSSRRPGRSTGRTRQRVTACPDQAGGDTGAGEPGRPAGGSGAFRRSARSYAGDGHCSTGDRRHPPLSGRGRTTVAQLRSGGRRRELDRGGAGHLAQHHGTVGGRLRSRAGRAAPGEVLAVRAGTPQGGARDQAAPPVRVGCGHVRRPDDGAAGRVDRGVGSRTPGQVLALRAGAPQRRAPNQGGEPADGGRGRRGGHLGNARCTRQRAGHGGRPDRTERHRPDGAPPRARRAVVRRPPGSRAAGYRASARAVEDVEQRGHAEPGLQGDRVVRQARRGRPLAAAHVASRSRVRDRGRCRGQGEN